MTSILFHGKSTKLRNRSQRRLKKIVGRTMVCSTCFDIKYHFWWNE